MADGPIQTRETIAGTWDEGGLTLCLGQGPADPAPGWRAPWTRERGDRSARRRLSKDKSDRQAGSPDLARVSSGQERPSPPETGRALSRGPSRVLTPCGTTMALP